MPLWNRQFRINQTTVAKQARDATQVRHLMLDAERSANTRGNLDFLAMLQMLKLQVSDSFCLFAWLLGCSTGPNDIEAGIEGPGIQVKESFITPRAMQKGKSYLKPVV